MKSLFKNHFCRNKNILKISGKKIFVPDDMLWCFKGNVYYETNVNYWVDVLVKYANKPVLYDIGANIGYYSVTLADKCSCIYSFEPVTTTCKILRENVRRNKIGNSKIYNLGLSDRSGTSIINLYNSSGNNSIYTRTVPPGHGLKKTGEDEIQLLTLDGFIIKEKAAIPNIIKMDVEGAELFVLKGALKLLEEHSPILLFEYADTTSNDAGYDKKEILKFLGERYAFFGIPENVNDFNLVELDINSSASNIANIIAIPRKIHAYFNKWMDNYEQQNFSNRRSGFYRKPSCSSPS